MRRGFVRREPERGRAASRWVRGAGVESEQAMTTPRATLATLPPEVQARVKKIEDFLYRWEARPELLFGFPLTPVWAWLERAERKERGA